MTPTERLQAKWPKWEIVVRENPYVRQPWLWEAGLVDTNVWFNDTDYKTEEGACQSCNCALKAIRRAVSE